jgi:hypothetical protein
METALKLYRLQQAELERAESANRLAQVKAALLDNSLVDAAASAEQQTRAVQTKAQADARALELEVQSVKTKLRNSQERMFSGKVSNPKELASLQGEGESLQRRIATLEDSLLDAMIALEEAQERHDSAAAHLAEITTERERQVVDLTAEQERLERRCAELDSAIAEIRASLDAGDLGLYDHLARRKANRPVALLSRSNVCGACGVSVPLSFASQTRAHGELVFCPSCERILYSQG